jgi:hypothetical protein
LQPSVRQASPRPGARAWLTPTILASLLLYFFAFSWDRVFTHFAADDMMNMGKYFDLGPWRALASQFLLWQNFYRPMGAAFYLPLHHWFGLNPVPFQIAILSILAVNLCLVFGLARALGCSHLAAGLAALVAAYHAGLPNLQYNIDMVYDVLCFLFFAGGLLYYTRIRGQNRTLRVPEAALFILLFVCALNSKEMALTMPLVLCAYEWIYHPPALWNRGTVTRWARGPGSVVMVAGALDVLNLYGRRFGPDAMMRNPAYQPVFSLERFVAFQKGAFHDLFCGLTTFQWTGVALVWVLVTYLAWRRNRPVLRFAWAYVVITPLPITFLNDRFQGSLYIPLAGWAILAAMIFLDLAHALSAFLAEEPILRWLGRKPAFAVIVAVGVFLWAREMRHLKAALVVPAAAQQGIETWNVIQQLQKLNPQVRPHSKIVFLNDPFIDWDMTFIGTLWFHDRSIQVYTRKQQLSPENLAAMDYVFDFRDSRLVQVK